MPLRPRPEQLQQLLALPADRPVSMLNLLRFQPDGGRARYEEYLRAVRPLLVDTGATLVFTGEVGALVIGPEEEAWDRVLLVTYPSAQVFLAFGQSAEMRRLAELRESALADYRLIACH